MESRSEVVQLKRDEEKKREREKRHSMAMELELQRNQDTTLASIFKPRPQIIGNQNFDMLDF